MLEAVNLECVRGERRLFRGVGFELAEGTLLEVVGPNGSGKTSLLRMVCGLLAPAAGEILWRGEPIRAAAEEFRGQLAYLGHLNGIKDDLTGVENLVFSETMAGGGATPRAARDALARLGLAGFEDLPTRVLSQGQKRRVALARLAFRERCRLWVLDEPFVALDAAAVRLVADLIANQADSGGIVLLTTHQEVDVPVRTRRTLRLGAA
ncbi:MAG: cytochrome c biogenesis heme-transporting ATPase CcmA [Burkholderiales bacterium]|nr:cytochrome c biogenesis heme-transporting ATPase CcmA [Burkholderiales bacterium]